MLIGRAAERAAVGELLRQARDGRSGTLVVRGEAGIGKSAILDHAVELAQGFRILRVTGIESEMEFAFAALQQLCGPIIGHLDRLPDPQAAAIRIAFGMSDGAPPDRFLVGLGVLGLAAEAAAGQPLLCLADDVQWIDQTSLQALAFAARRLYGESVAVIFAARAASALPELAGLPELAVGALPDTQARSLLTSVLPGRLDERVRDRIVAEAGGNPLALLEFSREVADAGELAGGFGVSPWLPRPVTDRVEARYLSRATGLPRPARQLLLLAASEPLGDPVLLERAAGLLGLRIDQIGPAEAAGLVRLGTRVTFRHPLVRSAIYRSALAADRHAMHAVLAEVTDQDRDPDHRAWHRAHATFGPDESVAADLERSAGRALARGGPGAAAAFLGRAAALSPEPGRRAELNLAAAHARYDAGGVSAAAELVVAAQAGPLDELQQARAELLAARVMTAISLSVDAPGLLVRTAARFAPLDPGLARRAVLDAIMAAMLLSGSGVVTDWRPIARAAPAATSTAAARADDYLLDGLVQQATGGYAAGLTTLRQAFKAFLAEPPRQGVSVGVLWLACRSAMNTWADETWYLLASRLVASARRAGTLIDLPAALSLLAVATLHSGDFAATESLVEETDTVVAATGTHPSALGRLTLAAWRGEPVPGGTGPPATIIGAYAAAVRGNGLGRYDEALAAAQGWESGAGQLGYALWILPELAEAAARCGRPDVADAALRQLRETTEASGTDWGLGLMARSQALVSSGPAADELYQEAISRLGRTRIAVQLARAHLVYGEWLRREKRRTDARAQLRTARDMLTAMGAEAFAQRAERELTATGERVRRRDTGPVVALTPQESQIARLASDGQSNPEIAAQLFLSPRTVEYHLHKIYAKLDITTRGQLARALRSRP